MTLKLGLSLRLKQNAASSQFATGYPLALKFTTQDYNVSGTHYAALSSVPGYSYTDSVDNLPTIGASGYTASSADSADLRVGLAQADADWLLWVTVNDADMSVNRSIFEWSAAGSAANRLAMYGDSTGTSLLIVAAGATVLTQTPVPTGAQGADTSYIYLRQSGNWRGGLAVGGSIIWGGAAAAGAYPTGLSRLDIGTINNGGYGRPDANYKGAYLKTGTFASDAAILAAIAAV